MRHINQTLIIRGYKINIVLNIDSHSTNTNTCSSLCFVHFSTYWTSNRRLSHIHISECTHIQILNPDEVEQLSTYVPSLPHQEQLTQSEADEEGGGENPEGCRSWREEWECHGEKQRQTLSTGKQMSLFNWKWFMIQNPTKWNEMRGCGEMRPKNEQQQGADRTGWERWSFSSMAATCQICKSTKKQANKVFTTASQLLKLQTYF